MVDEARQIAVDGLFCSGTVFSLGGVPMLDTRNRAKPYRDLAEACRRLATNTPSSQMKNRYLLLAQDYMRLADLKERAHAHRTPATVEENAARPATMTDRFPAPCRAVAIPRGFGVGDPTGQQLAVSF